MPGWRRAVATRRASCATTTAPPRPSPGERHTLFLVDRAFIDARFWDAKKAKCAITIITRMKANLRIDSTEGLGVDADPVNAGVQRDLRVMLASSPEPWRLITYRTRRGHVVEFLTNDFDLQPGVVAFLYSRRWEEEIYQPCCLRKTLNAGCRRRRWTRRRGSSPSAVAPGVAHVDARARRRRPKSATAVGRHAEPGGPAASPCAAS
jgi:hypothetical protein